jgi:hypothetical protein
MTVAGYLETFPAGLNLKYGSVLEMTLSMTVYLPSTRAR